MVQGMKRPMKERLDDIMKDAHLRGDDAGVLAAEVSALRDVVAAAESRLREAYTNLTAAEATIARIEARVEAWKARADSPYWIQAAVEIELDMKGVGG